MRRFSLKRSITLLLILLAAFLLVFGVLELLPGNAAQALMGPDAAPEAVAVLAEQLGLNDGAARRYLRWIGGLLHGDLGSSYAYSAPVAAPIVERLMVTVPLALLAFARVGRASARSVWARDHCLAAQALSRSRWAITTRHHRPSCTAQYCCPILPPCWSSRPACNSHWRSWPRRRRNSSTRRCWRCFRGWP